MKKVSTGGIIVGILELLIGMGLIAVYVITSQDVRMDRMFDDPSTTFPVLSLMIGIFKVLGVIIIWIKQKFGVALYVFGSLISIYFVFTLSLDFSFAYPDERTPLLVLYAGIALQFWFIYIMSKAIRLKEA